MASNTNNSRTHYKDDDEPPSSSPMVALGVALVIAALYVGREILVPIALATLLSFALTPPMMWLRRRRMGRTLSAGMVVTVAFLVALGIGHMMVTQVSQLAENLPNYQQNLLDKIHFLQGGVGDSGGLFGRTADMMHRLSDEVQGHPDAAVPALPHTNKQTRLNGGIDTSKPIPVEIERPPPAPLEVLESVLGPLLTPLSTVGIIILYVISFLLQRENLRDRVIRLLGARDLHRTTEALNDAGERVSRYLLFQLMVNAVYAVPIAVGLTLIGVPNALLWSLLVVLMRFLPYLGIVLAAIFPLALAIAVDPGWNMLIYTATLYISVELISANLIEPWLYGTKTGLSPIAILVAATFWTWLWGPVGLLLSTPLTVCLVVLGRHVPQLFFLHVMLGNDAPLAREESLYQRLLADDPAEAVSHCEAYIKEHPLTEFYDRVVIPALVLAERDNDRGVLNRKLRMRIRNGVAELIEYFAALDPSEVFTPDQPIPKRTDDKTASVLCLAGRNDFDEAAAALLAQLLSICGISARLAQVDDLSTAAESDIFNDLARTLSTKTVCVSCISENSAARARLLVRKLRRRHIADTQILVGFWGMGQLNEAERLERKESTGADLVVTSLNEAINDVLQSTPAADTDLDDLINVAASALSKAFE